MHIKSVSSQSVSCRSGVVAAKHKLSRSQQYVQISIYFSGWNPKKEEEKKKHSWIGTRIHFSFKFELKKR